VARGFFSLVDTLPASSTAGRYTWTAIARDNAGNMAKAQKVVTVDSLAGG
jgi:hypothetical protein